MIDGEDIINEIVKQGMVQPDGPPTVLIWKANAPEQLEALVNRDLLEMAEMLRKWKKWADMGIGDFLPSHLEPVMTSMYDETVDVLNKI